jgi:hypothetical protein
VWTVLDGSPHPRGAAYNFMAIMHKICKHQLLLSSVHLSRRFINSEAAALWTLKAQQGRLPDRFRRPQVWETAGNAQALDRIGPDDKFGVTKEVQVRLGGGSVQLRIGAGKKACRAPAWPMVLPCDSCRQDQGLDLLLWRP